MEQSFIYFEITVTTLPDEFEFEKVICTYILLGTIKIVRLFEKLMFEKSGFI